MNKERLLKLKEVAEHLRVSERSVFRYIHEGELRATKIGYWRISEKDLGDFLISNIISNKNRKNYGDSKKKKKR